jgi:hypothetical protein
MIQVRREGLVYEIMPGDGKPKRAMGAGSNCKLLHGSPRQTHQQTLSVTAAMVGPRANTGPDFRPKVAPSIFMAKN